MHHALPFYGRHQHRLIHLYIDLARWTRLPVIGWVVRRAANLWGLLGHSGYYLTLKEAEAIVDAADSIALGPCSCRREFHNCKYPIMSEIVLGKGGRSVYSSRAKEFRSVTPMEAKEVLRKAHAHHLTQSIMRCGGHFYALCNCCSCCCVPTRLKNEFGIGRALVRNRHVVEDFKKQILR